MPPTFGKLLFVPARAVQAELMKSIDFQSGLVARKSFQIFSLFCTLAKMSPSFDPELPNMTLDTFESVVPASPMKPPPPAML